MMHGQRLQLTFRIPYQVRGRPDPESSIETFENLPFLSFPRKRESRKPLKTLDSRLRGNDDGNAGMTRNVIFSKIQRSRIINKI
jgi:hypothetical protein